MVQHKCGKHYIERNKKNKQEATLAIEEPNNNLLQLPISKVELYSSYLGKVPVFARCDGDNVYCETVYITEKQRSIFIKVLDLLENKLSDTYIYPVDQLINLRAVCINKQENIYKYALALLCYININKMEHSNENVAKYTKLYDEVIDQNIIKRIKCEHPELLLSIPMASSKFYKSILQKTLEYNSRVDILFTAIEYLEFINRMTNGHVDTINNQNILIFISGVPKLDNAYWNGNYMVFGNGDSKFYPLTSIDVIGHELTHGLTQGICDFEYRGHSGALSESYADIFGAMLEFYVYDKYHNKLLGKCDWCIGEDLVIDKSCLRDMQNPHACEQPAKMYDEFYVDPNSMIDYGGVHINSGIPNHCFYLTSQKMDKYEVLKLFINCLYKLFRHTNFIGFSDVLADLAVNDNIYDALAKVGLPQMPKNIPTRSKPVPIPIPQTPIPQHTPTHLPRSPFPVPKSPGRTNIPPSPTSNTKPIPPKAPRYKSPLPTPGPMDMRFPDYNPYNPGYYPPIHFPPFPNPYMPYPPYTFPYYTPHFMTPNSSFNHLDMEVEEEIDE